LTCFTELDTLGSEMPKRVRIGDIVEIPTAKGFAYAQLSHNHARYGALLRVLPGLFKSAPNNFPDLARKSENFVIFFPLQAAVNRTIFRIVANSPVPEFAKSFPLFRTGVVDPRTGKVKVWWLWDGEKEWKVGEITPDQRKLPLRGIWNDTLLIERIEAGWTPENDPS
jgi:hypothetical protein